MLEVHHLGKSQSERIVWLCEELQIPYKLVVHTRDPKTKLAPPDLKAVHPLGTAPAIVDGDIALTESGAIVEYILTKYGRGSKLAAGPNDKNYAEYLFWFHFSNGTLQQAVSLNMFMRLADLPESSPMRPIVKARLDRPLNLLEERLKKSTFLAGENLTAADIMSVFSLTTARLFMPYSLEEQPSILAYLKRIGEREAYKKAMAKAEPDLPFYAEAQPPAKTFL